MTTDQVMLFCLLFLVFAFLVWGKLRYDLVAFISLIVALVIGVVPTEQAFSGFGHPATIIIALVLIVSKGLSSSGVIDLVARQLQRFSGYRSPVPTKLPSCMNFFQLRVPPPSQLGPPVAMPLLGGPGTPI